LLRPIRELKIPFELMKNHALQHLAAFTLATATVSASDWRQYVGPNFDRTTAEALKVSAFPAGGPKALWRVPMPNGFSSFAVADGRAFTQIAREVGGVEQEVVLAVDADTGKELWSQTVGMTRYGHDGGNAGARGNTGGDGPRSTPTVDGDHVFVLSSDLVLTSFEAASGKEVWKKDLLKEHGGKNITWKNAASPVIDGDMIFVAAGGGKGQALLALRKRDGGVLWKTEDDAMTHATPTVAELHGVRQVIFFTQKGLVSVATRSGMVLWRQDFPFRISTAASPVVSGNIVYCAAGYGVGAGAYSITKSGTTWSSRELWRSPGDKPVANHWSTPVVKNGFLYGMFSFKEYGDGPLKCVDIATGKVMWEQAGFGQGNVILSGDTIIALADDGQLVLVAANSREYTELARAKVLDGKCWSTPVLSKGRIYARSTKEGVCLDVSGE
jgi:outer membrane protein assembly factor BamB